MVDFYISRDAIQMMAFRPGLSSGNRPHPAAQPGIVSGVARKRFILWDRRRVFRTAAQRR